MTGGHIETVRGALKVVAFNDVKSINDSTFADFNFGGVRGLAGLADHLLSCNIPVRI